MAFAEFMLFPPSELPCDRSIRDASGFFIVLLCYKVLSNLDFGFHKRPLVFCFYFPVPQLHVFPRCRVLNPLVSSSCPVGVPFCSGGLGRPPGH